MPPLSLSFMSCKNTVNHEYKTLWNTRYTRERLQIYVAVVESAKSAQIASNALNALCCVWKKSHRKNVKLKKVKINGITRNKWKVIPHWQYRNCNNVRNNKIHLLVTRAHFRLIASNGCFLSSFKFHQTSRNRCPPKVTILISFFGSPGEVLSIAKKNSHGINNS